jgi:hypothetical protein
MKNYLFLFLMISTATASGQKKEFRFNPKWKIGENRKIVFSSEVPWRDSVTYQFTKARIVNFGNDNYTIEFQTDNELYKSLQEMFSPRKVNKSEVNKSEFRIPPPDSTTLALNKTLIKLIEDDFSQFKNITLIYEINKLTGERTIKNFDKIKSDNILILKNFAEKYFNVTHDSLNQVYIYVLSPVLDPFESAESLELKFKDTFGLFFFPYGLVLAKGDTINKIEKANYEIGGYRKRLAETTDSVKIWLDKVNETEKTVEIKCTKKSGFDLGRNRIGIDFNEITIIYDLKSSWPIKSTSKNWREFKSPKVMTNKPSISTLIIE